MAGQEEGAQRWKKGSMSSRERMRTAMNHGIPDRVPFMCQLALGHYFLHAGLRPHEVWFTSDGFATAVLRERYGFDGVLLNIPGRDPDLLSHVTSLTDTPEGEVMKWDNGDTTTVPYDDSPSHAVGDPAAGRPLFETFDPVTDFDRLDDWRMYVWGCYHTPFFPGKSPGLMTTPPPHYLRTIDREISVHGETFSPFHHFVELFGIQESLAACCSHPTKVLAILDKLTVSSSVGAAVQAERGVDAVLLSSPYVGGGFISPRMYRKFVLPFEKKVVEAVKAVAPQVAVYTHTCGKIGDRLELLEETGVDGLDTLDPPPLGDTELADAKARVGSRLFIKGNMDSVKLLKAPDVETVVEHGRTRLRDGMPGGGYILASACSVAPRVEPEKLLALRQLVEEEGWYTSDTT